MPVETDADRTDLLADFGVTATYGASTFTVIIETEYVEAEGVAGYKPVLIARTKDTDAASVVIGGTITVNSVNYTVQVIQADGTGFTRLILEEV